MNLGRKEKAQDEPPRKRSQLERLEDLAARLTADRAALDVRIPELAAREFELRREGVRRGERSDVGGAISEVYKLVADREKLERQVPALDAELAAVAVELQAIREEAERVRFDEAMAGIGELNARENAAIDNIRAAFQAFVARCDDLTAVHAERAAYGGDLRFTEHAQAAQFTAAKEPIWRPAGVTEALERFLREHLTPPSDSEVVSSYNPDLEPLRPVPERRPSYMAGWEPHANQQQKRDAVNDILDSLNVPA